MLITRKKLLVDTHQEGKEVQCAFFFLALHRQSERDPFNTNGFKRVEKENSYLAFLMFS